MQYVCRVGTPDGRVLTQVQNGADEGTVRRELERQGFHIFDVRARGMSLRFSLSRGQRRGKISAQRFLAFNQELAALLRAGLPLLQSLELMLERMDDDPVFKDVLSDVYERVKSGGELSEAFAELGGSVPALYPATLKAGERSGELEQVIRRFIRYQQLVLSAKKRVVSALVYPTVLIGLSLGMMVIMAIFVVPSFSRFYGDLGAELPTITRITLGTSFFLRDYFLWLLGAGVVGYLLLRRWISTEKGRQTVDRWRLRLPLLGHITRSFSLAEFCRSLSTLLAGGIPLLSALETAIDAVSNTYIRLRLQPASGQVREGGAFYEAIESTGAFPNLAINMIKVGEATGALDEMLASIADYFDDQVETRVQRLLSLIEPAMLVIMGILIGVLLISIYLPMFSVIGQVGN